MHDVGCLCLKGAVHAEATYALLARPFAVVTYTELSSASSSFHPDLIRTDVYGSESTAGELTLGKRWELLN